MIKKCFFFIFILNTIVLAYAQNSQPFAMARKVKGLEVVPEQIRQRFERLALQVVLKQQDYQVLMSPDDIPTSSAVDIVAVESEISKENEGYKIETSLFDIRNKKLIRRARIKNVREEDLLRLYQASVEAVFKKKVDPEEDATKEKAVREKTIPAPLSTNINNPSPNAIDFKGRINNMKSDIEKQFKNLAQKNQIKDLDEDKNSPEKKNTPPPNPVVTAKKNIAITEVILPPVAQKKFKGKTSFHVMAGMDKRVVDSQYLINTKTNTQMLTFKLLSHNTTKFFSERMAWSYDFSVSKLLSGKIDLPTLYQAGIYGTWLDNWGHISMGIMKDKSFISNLTAPGEGLKITNLETTWYMIRGELNFSNLADTKLTVAYGIPLLVSAQIDQLQQWQGSMYRVGIIPPRLVRNWDLNIILERISLTNQGVVPFTSEDSRIALLVQRSF